MLALLAISAAMWSATPDGADLIARSIAAEVENRARQVNYLFVERITRKAFDRDRRLTNQQQTGFEVLYIAGKPAYRRVSVNNRALTEEEETAESARLRQIAEDRRRNPDIASPSDDRRRGHPYSRFPALHKFVFHGEEKMDGRDCWVVESEPKPGRRPSTRDERLIAGATARFWIDKETLHRVRMDVTARKPLGAAKVREYTSYHWAQRDGSVWLIVEIRTVLPIEGTGNLVAYYESEQSYSRYRRFTSESSLSEVEEVVPATPSTPQP